MKVAFVLLAYKKPELLRPLIETLLSSGSDIYVHYDASSPYDLEKAADTWGLEQYKGKLYHSQRIHVVWGEWSIVQATLNCLNLAKEHGYNSDYFMLISGSCMPIKPIWELEDFLKEQSNTDFIEVVNAAENKWITSGIQKERWEYYHFFNWRYQRKRFNGALKLQDKLKIKRVLPLKHTPFMGSQWWCLRTDTVKKILALMTENRVLETFYKRTWVPDELFFQTMVGNLIPSEEINDDLLTRYQFNSRGVPRVYYNDDLPELLAEETFFARKISPRAQTLRHELSQVCRMDQPSYQKMMTDIHNPHAAELRKKLWLKRELDSIEWFALATSHEDSYEYLKDIPNSFIIVTGNSKAKRQAVLSQLKSLSETVVFGDLFGDKTIDFGNGEDIVAGYARQNREYADNKWHLFLGDLAFRNPDKIVVFSIAHDPAIFLHKLRWKRALLTIVIEDDAEETCESLSLNQILSCHNEVSQREKRSKHIFHELQERHCQAMFILSDNLSNLCEELKMYYLDELKPLTDLKKPFKQWVAES